jgi:hypothetical protein
VLHEWRTELTGTRTKTPRPVHRAPTNTSFVPTRGAHTGDGAAAPPTVRFTPTAWHTHEVARLLPPTFVSHQLAGHTHGDGAAGSHCPHQHSFRTNLRGTRTETAREGRLAPTSVHLLSRGAHTPRHCGRITKSPPIHVLQILTAVTSPRPLHAGNAVSKR